MTIRSFFAWWLLGAVIVLLLVSTLGHIADDAVASYLLLPGVAVAMLLGRSRMDVFTFGIPLTGLLCPLIVWLRHRMRSRTTNSA